MSKQAEKMARDIAQLDFENGDIFCFKFGGDGDNGEHLIYLLDKHFKSEPSVPVSELEAILRRLNGTLYYGTRHVTRDLERLVVAAKGGE
jgi:hypothetical protein